jgi:D-amino acid aminotransferase
MTLKELGRDKKMGKVFLNDKLVEAEDAKISVADAGFLYGAGLFETMRAQNGTIFCLKDHMDRLLFSAAKLGFNLPQDPSTLSAALNDVLQANQLQEARLRLTVSAGAVTAGQDEPVPTLLITAARLQAYPEEYYRDGVIVVLCPYRQNPTDPTAGHKSTSYFSRMLALQQARTQKAAESLWFTTEGNLTEGCISNVFLVKDGQLLTPPIETPVLPGVARETVCQIAVRNKLELVEKPLRIDDLLGAHEVFVSNVIMKVMPVVAIEKHAVGEGKVGPITEDLKHSFNDEIDRQCGGQA